jgi:hypothetical protein
MCKKSDVRKLTGTGIQCAAPAMRIQLSRVTPDMRIFCDKIKYSTVIPKM